MKGIQVPDTELCEKCGNSTLPFDRIRVQDYEGNMHHACSFMCAFAIRRKINKEKDEKDQNNSKR